MRRLMLLLALTALGIGAYGFQINGQAQADVLIIRDGPCAIFADQPFPGSRTDDFDGLIDESTLPEFNLGDDDNPFITRVLWSDSQQLVQNDNGTHVRCTFNGNNADWLPEPPAKAFRIPFECFMSARGHAVLTPSGKLTVVCHWDSPLIQ